MEKRHNIVKVVLLATLVFVLLSWILPAAYFQESYVEQGRVQIGLFDLFSYPITTTLAYFGNILLFILVIGGFYGVLNRIGAYRKMLDSMAKSLKKQGKLVISIMMVLLAVITSICGLQLGLMLFFPFLISLILLMGYDKIVAALTVVGSTMIGIAGTTFAYSNVSVIYTLFSLKITSNILIKIFVLVLGLAVLIGNTIIYISKNNKPSKAAKKSTKKDSSKEEKNIDEVLIPAESKSKASIVPIIVIFSIIFVIMILAFIPWSNSFTNNAFVTATEGVTGFKIFNFALFGKLLGKSVLPFGNWTLTELITLTVISTLVLALIYKVKANELYDGLFEGMKKALIPAVVAMLVYTCLVINTYHPFQLVIYKAIFGITKGFNIFTATLTSILASVFNVEPLYSFQSVLPYLSSIVSKDSLATIAALYPATYGFTMLFAPTSAVLMVTLSYMGVSYKDWFKNIWKILLELLIVILVLFLVFSPMSIILKIVLLVISIAVLVLMTLSSLSII